MYKRLSILALTAALLFGLFPGMTQTAAADASTYYVSADGGDDGNPGTEGSPFKTIQKAADVAQAGDTVVIRGGTYRETVTPAGSGTDGNPISFQAYPGETVTISGAEPVTAEWTVQDSVYKADVTLPLGPENQVFADGEMMVEARWPNVASQADFMSDPMLATAASASSTAIADDALSEVTNFYAGARVWVEESHHWVGQTSVITASEAGSITYDSLPYSDAMPGAGSRYYIYGSLNLLDAPSEWYYDSGTLYLHAPDGQTPVDVEYKARQYVFELANRSYIEISGINLFAGSIHTDDSDHIVMDGIQARYVTHTNTPGYAWGDDTTGILINGDDNVLRNSTIAYSSGNCVVVTGSRNLIVNNEIHECDYNGTDDAGIYISTLYTAADNLLAYNTIYNTGRGSILMKYAPGTRIAHNDLSHFSQLMDDAGALYVFQTDGMGSEIDHNYVHDAGEGLISGIYLDNGSSNYLVHHNVVWNVPNALMMNMPSSFNLVYNNTFIDSEPQDGNDWYDSQLFNNITGPTTPSNDAVWGNNLPTVDLSALKFADAAAGNFRLLEGSIAIDAGKELPGVTDGFIGEAPDVGAYEFGGADWTAGRSFDAPPSLAYSLTDTPYKNLLTNSDFEKGLGAWTTTGEQSAVSDQTAVKAGRLNVRLGANDNGIEQTVTGLAPGTAYTLSGWGAVGNADTTVRLGVKDYGGDEVYATFESTELVRQEVTFTTGDAQTSATVYFYRPSGGTASAFGDSFGLTLVQPEATPFFLDTIQYKDNIVTNPGFESDYDGWSGDWGNTSITTESEHVRSGSKALKIGTTTGGRVHPISAPAVPGGTYRFGGWLKVSDLADAGFLGLAFYDANGDQINENKLTFKSLTYEYKEIVLQAPPNAATMEVFVFELNSVDYVYADDITLNPAVDDGGSEEPDDSLVNIALLKPVTISTPNWLSENAVTDGILTSAVDSDSVMWAFWAPGSQEPGEWVYIDLGESKDIGLVKIQFPWLRGDWTNAAEYFSFGNVPASITFQVSDDASEWQTVISKSTNVPERLAPFTPDLFSYPMHARGRYLRLLFEDAAQGSEWDSPGVAEVQVYEASTAPASSDIAIVNHFGETPDTIEVSNVTPGDVVNVYSAATDGDLLGTAAVGAGKTAATITVAQIGAEAGNVYVTVTQADKVESARTQAAFDAELSPFQIMDGTLTNARGITATVTVKPVENHAGNEVVIFQLMSGSVPQQIVAIESDIDSDDRFIAHFNVSGNYTVKVFVMSKYSDDAGDVGISLAVPVILRRDPN